MNSYCMDEMALHRVESLSMSLKNVANLIVDKSGILKLDTWTLYELVEAFSIILDVEQHTNFHVLPIREQQDNLTSNLQFAYDLLQRVKKLQIFTNPRKPLPVEQVIHLRCLRNLFNLELDHVSIDQLKGLQNMRSTLQSLIIRGSDLKLEQLLTCCGADKATEYPWEKLQIGVFSYNKMPHLDDSLKLLPSIKVLDFSHCGLVDVSALTSLQTLKHLNLSHNKLSSIPNFKDSVTYTLATFNISSNLIYDLKGIEDLVNLEELNAANNLLSINESILCLRQLSQLRCLSLMGNPITYNLNYRIHTLRLLNSATFFCEDLQFDGEPVGREERKEISAIAEMFLPQHTGRLESLSSSMKAIVTSTTEVGDVGGRNKPIFDLGSDEADQSASSMSNIDTSKKRKKKSRTRYADIKDPSNEENEVIPEPPSFQSFSYFLKSGAEDKRLICEDPKPGDINYMSPSHTDQLLEEILQASPNGLLFTEEQENSIMPHKPASPDDQGLDDSMLSSTDSSFLKAMETVSRQSSDISAVPSEVEEEENNVIWLLAKKQHLNNAVSLEEEDVILVTSDSFFREKNALTSKTNAVWTVGGLDSMEILSLDPPKVKINFRSYAPVNRYSIYTMAKDDFQTLKAILDPIMERNTMKEIYKSAMNCVKCESEFPRNENTRSDGKVFCPNCGSGVVLMTTFEDSAKSDDLQEHNLMCHGNQVHRAYERSPEYQASNEVTPLFLETGSSAVSICSESSSNAIKQDSPEESMSSIEVVSETHQREDLPYISCEQLVQAASTADARTPSSSCATEHSELLSAAKMQESSSSGSMTGSICTAVDQSSTLNTPVHLKTSVADNYEENISDSVKEVEANKFIPWVNTILHSLTGYSWSWWDEIRSKEECLPVVLNQPFSYNYEDPSCADHRLKLHAEFFMFNETDEQLLGNFKAVILAGTDSSFCGFLIISNVKFYILEATGPEDPDLQSWVKTKHTYPYEEVTVLCSLLHNQGFAIRMKDLTAMIFFGDSQRTNNAFNFIYDCLDSGEQQISVEEWSPRQENRLCEQFDDIFIEEQPDASVSLFILVTMLEGEGKCSNEFLALSCSQILLFRADLKWYYPGDASKDTTLQFTKKEYLMNLSAIEVFSDTLLTLTFDRADGTPVRKWNIHVVSESTMCQLIQGLRVPWAQLFGIDLESAIAVYKINDGKYLGLRHLSNKTEHFCNEAKASKHLETNKFEWCEVVTYSDT